MKDSMSTIVSVARYSEPNYVFFEQLAGQATQNQKSINQKLFKVLQAEGETVINSALEKAIDCGLTPACQWVIDQKSQSALKRIFTRELGETSWEEAEAKHPNKAKELMNFKDVVKGRKFVPEKVLEFCAESKATDEASLFEVEVQITQNGKKIKLSERLKHLVEKFENNLKGEIQKNRDVTFEE